jgi:NAD(P)H-hydrate epimerase
VIVVTGPEMAALDRRTIDGLGVPSLSLMENAGQAVFQTIEQELGPLHGRRVVILCGAGNNGGDGFVIGRFCHAAGAALSFVLAADPQRFTEDAAYEWRQVASLTVIAAYRPDEVPAAMAAIAQADVLVDALLGTGVRPPLRPPYDALVAAVNAAPAPTVAVDLPSGLDASRHGQRDQAVCADLTVTLAFPKICLCQYPSRALAGRIAVADIGIPATLADELPDAPRLSDPASVRAAWPTLAPDQHKGEAGRLLVVAGSPGMAGAAALACRAALRSGAGYVTLVAPEAVVATVQGWVPEIVGLPTGDSGGRPTSLDEAVARASAVLVGPGLPPQRAAEWLGLLLPRLTQPTLIDAGGLAALAAHPDLWERRGPVPLCLTPHPGEFAPLVNGSVGEVQRDRLAAARAFATERGVHLVLKGALSVIAAPDGSLWINPTGHAGMATAGSGDVLAGVAAGLLAQGRGPELALRAAAYWHGAAAQAWRRGVAERCLIASDLIEALPAALEAVCQDPEPRGPTGITWLEL